MTLELVFPAAGPPVPTDHAYPLYGALSGVVPAFHAEGSPLRFAPLTGVGLPDGRLQLGPHSVLRVRLPDDQIRFALPLAGRRLDVAGCGIRLGVPAVRTLIPAPAVQARMVTFKVTRDDTPDDFLATARTKLAELGVGGDPQLPIHLDGDRAGEPKRRVVRIKGVAITGYALLVAELSAADSLTLQSSGLGGRTHLGCGFFLPASKEVG